MATLQSTLRLTLQDRVSQRARGISAMMDRLRGQSRALGRSNGAAGFGRLAGRVIALGGAYVGLSQAYRGTVGAAMDFESSMADVKKVVDTSPEGFAKLRNEVLDISKRLPMAASGLADIMAEAGQAGIAVRDLGRFTEFTAKSAVAFGMEAGNTGNIFAKLRNVYQLTQGDLEGLADVTNHLSNNMAARADEILDFTNRASGAATGLRLTAKEISAIGAAMVASGIVSETGARGLNALATNLAKPGKKTYTAFKAMGISFKEWRKLRDKNGPEAMRLLFETLNKMDPDRAMGAIADLVGKDFSDDFMKLVNNPEVLGEAFGYAANEAAYAGSVQTEYMNRADTAANKIALLMNNLKAVGIEMGARLAEVFGDVAKDLADALRGDDLKTSIFDRIGAAYTGFTKGIGGTNSDPFKALKNGLRDLRRFVFGTPITDDMMPWEIRDVQKQDEQSLAGISRRFEDLGASLRQIADGDVAGGLRKIGEAIGSLTGSRTGLGVGLGLLSLAAGLKALSLTLKLGFALWGPFRLFAIAAGITAVINAVKDVGSLRDFVDVLKGLEAVDWATIAIGIGMLIGPLRTLRWLWGGGKALGRTIRGGRGDPRRPPGGPTSGPSTKKDARGPWDPKPKPDAPSGAQKNRPVTHRRAPMGWSALGILMSMAAVLNDPLGPQAQETRGRIQELDGALTKRLSDFIGEMRRKLNGGQGDTGDRRGSASAAGALIGGRIGTGQSEALNSFLERMSTGPQEVTGGPVTTQPSGVQDVNLTNPPPRPNINVAATFNVYEAQDADAFSRDVGRKLSDMVSGVQADLEATPGY